MTANDVMVRVRQYAADTGASEKWDEEQWARVLNEGLRWFFDYRPECRLTATGTENSFTEVTNIYDDSTTLFLPDTYRVPLEDYILARFFRSDGADDRDRSRAKLHQDLFDARVGLRG